MEEMEFEARLREHLRPREPRPAAVARILAEARRRQRQAQQRQSQLWRWGAMAASVVLALGLGSAYWMNRETPQERAARQAAAQLEQALRISSRKVSQLEAKLVVTINSGVDLGISPRDQNN